MILLLLIICCAFTASGSTYYVATTGSDSNPGSSGSPWQTISKGTLTAVAGDTVVIKAGTYKENVFTQRNGIEGNPITFAGERDVSGNWLTIIDPSTVITNGWVAAGEIGAGVFKQTTPFTTSELAIGHQRVFFVKSTGDVTVDSQSAYTDAPTTGAGFLLLSTSATLHLQLNSNQLVTYWDGIEALWAFSGTTTYLRLRDGSSPNGLTINASPTTTAVSITNSYNVFRNLMVRGALYQFQLSTADAHHNTILSNYISAGYERVELGIDCHDNRILNNEITTDFYGYNNPGAWEYGSDTLSGVRAQHYAYNKYLMGSSTSYDEGIAIAAAGSTNTIAGNHVYKCLGEGIGILSFIGVTPVITNTIICGNRVENCTSVGIILSEGHTYTTVYSNSISDCNIGIRFHHMGVGGEANRVCYVYRNSSWLPVGIGQHIFFHFSSSSPATYKPKFLAYQNSFSGGLGGMIDNGFAQSNYGLTNCIFVNNIYSDTVYFYSDNSLWTNAGWMGIFDYNEVTPPYRNYYVTFPVWFGAHNIKSTTNQWANTQGTSFALPAGSQAIDSGLDIPATYPTLPWSGTSTGPAWDMGAFEFGNIITNSIARVRNLRVVRTGIP